MISKILTTLLVLLGLLVWVSWQTLMGVSAPQNATVSFVTEPWLSPYVCSTDWYYDRSFEDKTTEYKTILQTQLLPLADTVTLRELSFWHSWYGNCQQSNPPMLRGTQLDLQITLAEPPDEATKGKVIRAILQFIAADPRLAADLSNILTITFSNENYSAYSSWTFPYRQAVKALEAGLEDVALWALGQ